MSAAHEPAGRGFSVDVYERQPVYVGGKARSVEVPHTGQDGRPDLPGEHGFRFFPGFYRHITDPRKRIPYGSNRQGVFDNLVASQRGLARFGRPPLPVLVNFPKNLADLETILQDLARADTGLTSRDMHPFAHNLWRILTSSYERRQPAYERMNWWGYMQTDEQRHRDGTAPLAPFPYEFYGVGGLTHSLVAAQPKLMSSKTGGDILLLLTADPGAHTDRVLNGPTNEVGSRPGCGTRPPRWACATTSTTTSRAWRATR